MPSHGLLRFSVVHEAATASPNHNELAVGCGNFSLVHKGFTASIEVTY
jgi:hypothetical protein